jgi:hypothetical protein
VSNRIERVNYYERQYLRSFDFAAEQRYHLEMRRRLNLALHLWGIVDGLEIVREPADKSKPVEQVYVTPGMAIDPAGREIIVPFSRLLDEDDLLQINVAGRYSLWIAYDRELATPPSPGYRLCDMQDQYTRWRESYKILIRPSSFSLPVTLPNFSGPLPDDPAQEWPVRLGTIQIINVTGKLTIDAAEPEDRVYIGLKAQRILAPTLITTPPTNPADRILQKPTSLTPPLSVTVGADLFAEQNVVVGENFVIAGTTIKPQATGNLKVASDLFLQGNFYAGLAGKWLDLKTYIKSLMPDIKVKTIKIPLAPTTALLSNDTITETITSDLPQVSRAEMHVALSGIERVGWVDYLTWVGAVDLASPVTVQVNVAAITKQDTNVFDFKISWTVGPTSNPPPPQPSTLHIKSLTISYIAVFYP